MIQSMGHTAFTVEDMDASLKFYCDVLGCVKAFEIHREDGTPWIVYVRVPDGRFIELFYGGELKTLPGEHSIGFNHLCFEVDDVERVAQMLREADAPLDIAPQQGLDLNYQCWTHDPDGNRIEFMQIHPDSPQAAARRALADK
ncbi:VOC family protein [Alicyclobacillus fastidiosus]|uniref:VOC family protein n=1 Tax=Alicyclobacillus fastidiosus TaxID=392011 RepID=A0ABY6ZLW9_9BACL|nr:VOC family protein [Alicyclobacillus fastidiosus]WAH43593.1 VOC family protein [Alicyclobacillus fastidiosus]GMA59776.1 lactoylglutathione lyase [Alicyclobacillus fastidiosus]